MKALTGKLLEIVFFLLGLAFLLSNKWERLQEAHPTASQEFLVSKMVIFSGQWGLSLVAFISLMVVLARFSPWLKRLGGPSSKNPPPTDAGPLYALRTFPLHVAICVGSIGACLLTAQQWPHVAMGLAAFSLAAWVALGRRMGFDPADTQTQPQNGS